MAKTSSIESMIRECATNPLANKYRLPQYKKEGSKCNAEYKKALLHKQVCEQIVAFVDAHKDEKNCTFCFVIGAGVQKDAHKTSAFLKGYKKFDAEKVLTLMQMGETYNQYNGHKGKMNDIVWRLVDRYYTQVSTDLNQFIADLNKSEVLGKECGARGKYEMLCKNLNIPFSTKGKELSDAEREKIFGKTA